MRKEEKTAGRASEKKRVYIGVNEGFRLLALAVLAFAKKENDTDADGQTMQLCRDLLATAYGEDTFRCAAAV